MTQQAEAPDLGAQRALDLLPLGIAHTDAVATILSANHMLCEMLGHDLGYLLGRNLLEFAVGDLERYAQMIDFGVAFTASVMGPLAVDYQCSDGTIRHSTLWAWNHLADPEVGAVVCAFVPDASTRGLQAALGSIAEGDGVATTLGQLADATTGHPFEAEGCWLVRDDTGRRLVGDGALADSVRAALAHPGSWWTSWHAGGLRTCDDTRHGDEADRLLAAAGVAAWWAMPCPDASGHDAAVIVLRRDPGPISPNQIEHLEQIVATAGLAFERASTRAMLAHAAYHDPLTGLPNRSRFFERDHEHLAPGSALLYVDLDRFKPVNDRLGHTVGDLVLVTVADRIRRAVRPGDRIARFGGDEFVVECEGVGSDAEAVAIAERILEAIGEPIAADGARVTVGASIGIARTERGTGIADLLDRSDAALLTAKATGKGRWHLAPAPPDRLG